MRSDVALVDQRAPFSSSTCGRRPSGSSTGHTHHWHWYLPIQAPSCSNLILRGRGAMAAGVLAVARPAAALVPCGGTNRLAGHCPRMPSPRFSGRVRTRGVVARVAQDSSESADSIVKYVKSSISSSEDIFALAGLGFAAVAALWASVNLIEVIDKLPVLPLLFELIGILVAWLFIYNNLLFKSDREEFLKNVKISVSRILGQ